MKHILKRYQAHDRMTEINTMKHMAAAIPKDIKTIVGYVQNILLHQHWSNSYGVVLSDERKQEPNIRRVEDKLVFLHEKGFKHVSDQKANQEKMISICRDFSVVAAALCREAGIPARARCGFANYLETDKYIDHWVLEYWDEGKNKWMMADAQLDTLQQAALQLPFDPLDVSAKDFLTGARAWLLCREGTLNPALFGIFKWWGYEYLRCNLLLDVNSLLGMPMQPWDMWDGYKSLPIEEWTEKDYKTMDELALRMLQVDSNFADLHTFVEVNGKIKVPVASGEL